ncbi:clampless1 Clp1 protein [Lyophyllum atratum]|nr:clampless1 Clp1 protein [Lyophyllum atratum]
MVLQSNFAKRAVSNAENTPPASVLPSKSFFSRMRSHNTTRRSRRQGSTNKYTVEQAARRSRTKAPATSLQFKMRSIGAGPALPIPDIEMADAEPVASTSSSSTTVPVMLPKELGRPEYREVAREALLAADPDLTDVEPTYIRDGLEAFGPKLLKTLSSVRASPPTADVLPKELSIIVHDLTTALPSHMLAIYGPAPKPSSSPSSRPTPAPKRKITLYPVHSLYLAAHCARLPAFPSTTHVPTPTVAPGATSVEYTVPVKALCLPSPASYPRLSAFLYTKRADTLLASLLPLAPPPALLSHSQDQGAQRAYAAQLAGTYTPQALLQHALLVHGLWQNVCALGIFEDALWEVIDVAWKVLLGAIAMGTEGDVEAVFGEEL